MDKKEIIAKLKKAMITEEMVIPIYTKHIKTALLWSGLYPDLQEEIRLHMEKLKNESERHKHILAYTISKIEKVSDV